MSLNMGWLILWPLILGFGISAAIQAVVSHAQMSKLLPDDSPRTLTIAALLGAASSSCSYAAVALARSIYRKGANFTSAIAFQIASTNLVIELGIIMTLVLGWEFTLAEFIGGPLMIAIFAIIMRRFATPILLRKASEQANMGLSGRMEGHANMHDMSISGNGSIFKKLLSNKGRTSTSHYFFMDWASVWTDIVLGLLIAGAVSAWIPASFFEKFFFTSHPFISAVWGPIVGPLIAVITFVCSVGNVPLAAVLWNSGISFGGVISFIFADLLVLPILRIYTKYYGKKMATLLSLALYTAMVISGYIIEILFAVLKLTPDNRATNVINQNISLNYTSVLNIAFILVASYLALIFMRTGGPEMFKMMNDPHNTQHHSSHHHSHS